MKLNNYMEGKTKIIEVDTVRIDASNSGEFKEKMSELTKSQDAIIDFKHLEFIDSSGLSALVYLHKQSINDKTELRLANLSPKILDIIRTTGLTQILQIYPDIESAKKDM